MSWSPSSACGPGYHPASSRHRRDPSSSGVGTGELQNRVTHLGGTRQCSRTGRRAEAASEPKAWLSWPGHGEGPPGEACQNGSQRRWRGKQMTAFTGWCTSQPPWRIRPCSVHRPNRKAECAETCPLPLERGKGCKALPIAPRRWVTAVGAPVSWEKYLQRQLAGGLSYCTCRS